MYYLVIDLILVWIILLLGRELYRDGSSPFFVAVNESLRVVGKVFKPVIRIGISYVVKGGGGLLKAVMKLFRK